VITLLYQLEKTLEGVNKNYNKTSLEFKSPFKLSAEFRKLAKAESFFLSDNSDFTVFAGNKQRWVFSYPSYLNTTINVWKKDPTFLINLYESSEHNKGSYWMGVLTGAHDLN
jgi:hypothetical protein